jgi:hypothetical protein
VSGSFEAGNSLSDILNSFGRPHRCPAVFLYDKRHADPEKKSLNFIAKSISR